MRKRIFIGFLILVAVILAVFYGFQQYKVRERPPEDTQSERPDNLWKGGGTKETEKKVPGEILVMFKKETSQQTIDSIQEELPIKSLEMISDELDIYLIKVPDGKTSEVMQNLREYTAIKYAEPNYIRSY